MSVTSRQAANDSLAGFLTRFWVFLLAVLNYHHFAAGRGGFQTGIQVGLHARSAFKTGLSLFAAFGRVNKSLVHVGHGRASHRPPDVLINIFSDTANKNQGRVSTNNK